MKEDADEDIAKYDGEFSLYLSHDFYNTRLLKQSPSVSSRFPGQREKESYSVEWKFTSNECVREV